MTFCRRELCAAAVPFAQKFTPDLTGVKKNGIINSENGARRQTRCNRANLLAVFDNKCSP